MTGFDSKRQAAQDKLDDRLAKLVHAHKALQKEYQRGYDAGKAAQPEQEPVAYCYVQKGTSVDILTFDDAPDDAVDGTIFPLYTTPPKRPWVGLTDEEIDRLWSQSLEDTKGETYLPLREFARAIEAKLKEKNFD